MKTTPTKRLRRLGAGTAMGALVVSSLLLSAPAHAATFKTLSQFDVNSDETRATGHNQFLADGVRVYTEGSTSTDKAAGYYDVNQPLSAAQEPKMIWTANPGQTSNLKPSIQLVTDFDGDGTPDGILVGEPTYADGSALYGNDWWLSNGSAQFVKDAAPSHEGGFGSTNHGTLSQWRSAFHDANVVKEGWSLGSGVQGDGTIKQISFGTTNYRFAVAPTTTKTIQSDDVNTSDTRANGHNEFSFSGGVHVFTDGSGDTGPRTDGGSGTWNTDKAAGYFDVDQPLATAGEPSMDYSADDPALPGKQLVIDFDGNGTADGILVGEPVYGNDWWASGSTKGFVTDNAPSHSGGSGSANHGTLGQWRDAFPDAQILQGGWSLGSGIKGDGVINSITIGATEFHFVKSKVASTTDITRFSNNTPSVRSHVRVYVTVSAPGAVLTGGTVNIYYAGKLVGTATAASNGHASAVVMFPSSGTHTLKATFLGNDQATGSTQSIRIVVRK